MAFPNALMIEQPDSPRINETWDYITVERRYQVTGRFTREALKQGEYIPSIGYKDPETDAVYVDYDYESEVGYPILVVRFKKRINEKRSYDMNTYTFNRPIEQHPDFKMYWRYELYASDTTTSLPGWEKSATDKSQTEGQEVWAWSKTGPTAKQPHLRQEVKADKQGVDSYLVPSAIITKRKVYTSDDSGNGASRWTTEVGKLVEPKKAYGLILEQANWLIRSYRIVDDLYEFATTLELLYSPDPTGWDSEIYSNSSVEDDD